ncbi:helix-turn-helix domain-containing protein [Aliamphritea hakodatensis]|uniref:helix-turn-helix domain-containing protein n=1 Tax=Aliamphritea hakodatensis TaxID=2895352 RepID=UPI0022FD4B38|nr:helix-turn-helix domain-containing protein [Aliamphritea hakodatensis]
MKAHIPINSSSIERSALPLMMNQLTDTFSQLANDGLKLLTAISEDIASDEEQQQRIALADELFSIATNKPEQATICICFAELILRKIEDYEKDIEIPVSPPHELLALLMKQHSIKQADLKDIACQSTVSAILSGKREITKQQAKKLAAFFHTPVKVFL